METERQLWYLIELQGTFEGGFAVRVIKAYELFIVVVSDACFENVILLILTSSASASNNNLRFSRLLGVCDMFGNSFDVELIKERCCW